jgi:ABC-type glycerol-3-phosphate transport system substrate-binding protein
MRRIGIIFIVLMMLTLSVQPAFAADDGIKIAMLSDHDSLGFQSLVNSYMQETGVKVTIDFYDSVEDLNAVMNTQLMSSEGPDLIQGTDIPYWTFAERGVFADIAQLMENDPDISISDFLPNIVEPLRGVNGELYIMPASFDFLYVALNDDLLERAGLAGGEWTLQTIMKDCIDFTKMSSEFPSTYAMSWGNEYLSQAVQNELMSAIDFANKTPEFDRVSDQIIEYIHNPEIISSEYGFAMAGLVGIYDISNYLYFTYDMNLASYLEPATMIIFENNHYEIRNFPRNEDNKGECLYTPKLAFCINESGNKDGSWDLMKYLLSDEVQTGKGEPLYVIGNPVNIRASNMRMELIREQIEEQAEVKRQGGHPNGRLAGSKHGADDYVPLMNRYIDIYTELRANLTTPVLNDINLKENIVSSITSSPKLNVSQMRKEMTRIANVYFGEEGGDIESGYTVIYVVIGVIIGIAAVGI